MICKECSALLSLANTSGYCKRCHPKIMARNPEIRRRQREGIARKMADPEYRAEHIARCIRNGSNLTPEQIEQRRENGRRNAGHLKEAAAKVTSEMRAENGRKRRETVLSWCPPQWRPVYLDLTKRGRRAQDAKQIVLDMIAGKPLVLHAKQKGQLAWCPKEWRSRYHSLRSRHGAAEAKRLVLSEINAKRCEEMARLEAMSPFERQMEALKNGARLIAKPTYQRPDYDFTLGGIATGAI